MGMMGKLRETQEKIARLEDEQGRIEEVQKDLQSRIDLINEDIKRLDSGYREETKALEDEIRGKETDRRRTEKGLIGLKESMPPLYLSLGKIFDVSRPRNPELELLYLELDEVKTTILDLEFRIEKLL